MITFLPSKYMTSGYHHGRLITSWRERAYCICRHMQTFRYHGKMCPKYVIRVLIAYVSNISFSSNHIGLCESNWSVDCEFTSWQCYKPNLPFAPDVSRYCTALFQTFLILGPWHFAKTKDWKNIVKYFNQPGIHYRTMLKHQYCQFRISLHHNNIG